MDTNATSNVTSISYEDFYNISRFITGLILYPIICIFGIVGSVLSLIVFGQKKMRTSTNVFLSALAVADLIRLLNDALYFIDIVLLRTVPRAGNAMMAYVYPFSHYVLNQSVCVASWLTVCIGVERYIYVCHPEKVHVVCSVTKAKIASTGVFVIMSLIAIPSGLRYEKIALENAFGLYGITLSEFGRNERFMVVYTWIINLLRSVIPICVLIILNTCIFHALRRQRFHGKVSGSHRITVMLIVVIVVFVVCITPDAIMSTVFGYGYIEANYLVKGIREYTDTLLAFNSAVNFPIYCLGSQSFRETFREVFCVGARRAALRTNSRKPLLKEPTMYNESQL